MVDNNQTAKIKRFYSQVSDFRPVRRSTVVSLLASGDLEYRITGHWTDDPEADAMKDYTNTPWVTYAGGSWSNGSFELMELAYSKKYLMEVPAPLKDGNPYIRVTIYRKFWASGSNFSPRVGRHWSWEFRLTAKALEKINVTHGQLAGIS